MNRMDEICMEIVHKNVEKICIFPFGNIGFQIKNLLVSKYGYKNNILCIDTHLSKWNSSIFSFEVLKEIDWDKDNALLIIASDNPDIYCELREQVRGIVPQRSVLDHCPVNPLCYHNDPRVAALAIQASEIYKNEVSGAVAEAGVYRGDFAGYINRLFPSRKLYLFDSFEGFSSKSFDIENDNYDQIKKWEGYKADTSEDIVLRKLPYPDNAIFKKGYVPETLQDINDTFAFVNLDMDLYMPTYEALKFFWKHMSPGGYIFIHDVNNWDGCGKAVEDFCKKNNTGYICLNDRITAALVKPFEKNEDQPR